MTRDPRRLALAALLALLGLLGLALPFVPGLALLAAAAWALREERVAPSAPPAAPTAWHAVAEPLAVLGASAGGLTAGEAAARLADQGPNQLVEARGPGPLRTLLSQFASPIIGLLGVAAGVSALLGEWADAGAIAAIVVLNALLGFRQEYQAANAIAALRRMTAPQARVRRDGHARLVPATEVVRGDLLELEAGDLVAADARILEASALKTVEAALTGESEAVDKQAGLLATADLPLGEQANMAFMGTTVAHGAGLAVVVETGMGTQFGQIARLLAGATRRQATPLERRLEELGRGLSLAAGAIVALIFGVGLVRGLPPFDMFFTAVGLAVAAVPEGLPAVVTIALALGVGRMARRRALVRKLPAVETLGATGVICTDKTGTLTVGQMTARELLVGLRRVGVTGEGFEPVGELRAADGPLAAGEATRFLETLVGCTDAELARVDGRWQVVGDPLEGALLALGAKGGVHLAELRSRLPRGEVLPFDADRRLMAVACGPPARALVKGAPEALLPACTHLLDRGELRPLTAADRAAVLAEVGRMADAALRVLAAAERPLPAGLGLARAVDEGLTFLGLVGLQDPPRPEARPAVARCRAAGIRVVMITGDHPRTAGAIAHELGLGEGRVLAGAELEGLTDEALAARVTAVDVYARATAAHKLRIVRAWQARGQVVAMTGDGVNDAPAIAGADVGVGMGLGGTEVTKQAAAMVITDDNFASIVAAVEEGRGVYANIRKTILYLMGGNAAELLVVGSCAVAGWPMPLLPLHLLWINVVTDGLPALALAADRPDPGVMAAAPRRADAPLLDRSFLATAGLTALLSGGVTLAAYAYGLAHDGEALARTLAFATLVNEELIRAYGARSETRTLFELAPLSNRWLVAVILGSLVLQPWVLPIPGYAALFHLAPLPWPLALASLAWATLPLAVLELRKRALQAVA